jgi:uncharacterized membrane protein YhaH (DUF805 family)
MGGGHGAGAYMPLAYLALALCGLIPAAILGPARDRTRRGWAALVTAIILSGVASQRPFVGSYGTVFYCLCLSFFIGACVGGVAGHRAWLYGTYASFWYVIPLMVQRMREVPNLSNLIKVILLIVLLPGLIGAVSASGVLWLSAYFKRTEPDR